jgi:hypothetical protein
MTVSAVDMGVFFYEYLQVLVAFAAVVLAAKWKRSEFVPGLFFLLLYTIVDAVDVFLFTITDAVYIDFSQFGFVLLALIAFILAMKPADTAKPAGT